MLTTAVLLPAIHEHDGGREFISITTQNSTAINKLPQFIDARQNKDSYMRVKPTQKRRVEFLGNCHAKRTARTSTRSTPQACHGGPRCAGMLPRCSQLSVRRPMPMLGSPTLRPNAFHLPEQRPTPATSTRRLLRHVMPDACHKNSIKSAWDFFKIKAEAAQGLHVMTIKIHMQVAIRDIRTAPTTAASLERSRSPHLHF